MCTDFINRFRENASLLVVSNQLSTMLASISVGQLIHAMKCAMLYTPRGVYSDNTHCLAIVYRIPNTLVEIVEQESRVISKVKSRSRSNIFI